MSDLIEKQAAIDALGEEPEVWSGNDEYEQGLNNQWHYDVNALKDLPSVQPETCAYWDGESNFCALHRPSAQAEQKKGKWRHYEGYLTCSECGTEYDDDIMTHCGDDVPKFCPNCGAKMDEVENETEIN